METSIIFLSLLPKSILDYFLIQKILKLECPPDIHYTIDLLEKYKSTKINSLDLTNYKTRSELIYEYLIKNSIFITHFWSESYPIKLKHISNPPLLLYYKGNLPKPDIKTLAIVGSRNPNNYGISVIENIINQFKYEIQVMSGLAKGIDSIAHIYSLKNSIKNFAVLGNGIDSIYPFNHKYIADKILNLDGGIISEYPPGTEARPYNFPLRNRIIAALSDVVWIPQATSKSGSLHTAIHALEQNKTIAVTPGNIFDELSDLPNRLLQEGAHPILKCDDLEMLLL